MIDRLVGAAAPASTCCRLLDVFRQGYYRYRKRPISAIELRSRWNTISEYIEMFYNYRRRHSSLECATPHDYDLDRTPRAPTTTGN